MDKKKKKDKRNNKVEPEIVENVAEDVLPQLSEEEIAQQKEEIEKLKIEREKERQEILERERKEEEEIKKREREEEKIRIRDKNYQVRSSGSGWWTLLDRHRKTEKLYFKTKLELYDYIEKTTDGQELYNLYKKMRSR